MKRPKVAVSRHAAALALATEFTLMDEMEIELRSNHNWKTMEIVQRKGLMNAQVARLAGTSRACVTAIMNRCTKDIANDLLLHVIYALSYTAKISFQKAT